MALDERNDPYMSFRFTIEIDGIIEGGFTDLTGLEATTQVEDYREGGVNDYIHKLPKETVFGNLTLKRGLADCEKLWKWHRDVIAGEIKRKNVHIYLLENNIDQIKKEWSFKEAYPVKWSGPDFKADGSAVAFESLEITHHGYI